MSDELKELKEIADTLDPQMSVQKIDMLEDDTAQALWSGIRLKI